MKTKNLVTTVLLSAALFSVADTKAQQNKFIKEGVWRGVFELGNGEEAPFNFEVKGKSASLAKIYFLNAEERFEYAKITQVGDSLIVPLDLFDNELVFKVSENQLNGVFRKQDKSGTPTTFKAQFGEQFRFKETGVKPLQDISGTYDVNFKSADGKETKTVGLFTQKGNKLRATFLKITGDSRYLDGIVEGKNFYLSSFIGAGASVYKGTISEDGSLSGRLISPLGEQAFNGIKNDAAALPDPYKLTYLREGYKSFDFSFPDLSGKQVSLKDEKYKNKVVIVTITGTWCPNCVDEAAFLSPWFKKNKDRGVEAIAIHYERKADPEYVQKVIGRFKVRYQISYDEVFAGLADKKGVAESLPSLNTFLSFPTILFIDKKGNVDKIYTGYNGPATGKYHEQFVKEFNQEVDKLLKQDTEPSK